MSRLDVSVQAWFVDGGVEGLAVNRFLPVALSQAHELPPELLEPLAFAGMLFERLCASGCD
jgi:hypothetical protein